MRCTRSATVPPPKVHKTAVHAAAVTAKQQNGEEQCHCFANEDSAIGLCEGGSGSAGGPGLPMGTCMQDPLCHWGPEEDPMCGAPAASTGQPPKHRLAAVLSATA